MYASVAPRIYILVEGLETPVRLLVVATGRAATDLIAYHVQRLLLPAPSSQKWTKSEANAGLLRSKTTVRGRIVCWTS